MFPRKLTKSVDVVKLKIRQQKEVHYDGLYVEPNLESSLPLRRETEIFTVKL